MKKIRFSLDIPAEEYLRYYQGSASRVMVLAENGQRVQLPAISFRPFVCDQGLQGRFEIALDENNKLMEIKRLT